MLHDRRVLGCAALAAVIAFANEWWSTDVPGVAAAFGDSAYWLSRLAWVAPYAVALVAVVWTARPGAGVSVAAVALVSSLLAVVLRDGTSLSLHGVLAYLLDVVALLPADVMVAARRRPDALTGAAAGLACGTVLAVVTFLWVLPLVDVPPWYVLGGYVLPPVALTLVGLAAGAWSQGRSGLGSVAGGGGLRL